MPRVIVQVSRFIRPTMTRNANGVRASVQITMPTDATCSVATTIPIATPTRTCPASWRMLSQ